MNNTTGQKGITLVETLVAAGIGAMILSVLGSSIFLFLKVTEQDAARLNTLHDVQSVGYWINQDGRSAQNASVGGSTQNMTLALQWDDEGDSHTAIYYRGDNGSRLIRSLNNDLGTTEIIVARTVSSVDYSISAQGLITGNLTFSPSGRWGVNEEVTYKIWPRPND